MGEEAEFKVENNLNLTMLADFYELTMSNGYFMQGKKDEIGYFDMFFRKIPEDGGFAIMCGVQQLVEYMKDIRFTDTDIEFLRSKKMFSEEFLEYLKNFEFCCDVWTVPEGTPIFPHEPICVVKGPLIQAQFLETMLLLTINHQSLIATKASRIVRAADGRKVFEFGSRRAQGAFGAIYGARAAYIGGCDGTACTICEKMFDIPAVGTMAHSWIQAFDSEYEAFKAYAENYPDNCVLLIDTYNVLKSGIVNAIKVFKEVLGPMGKRPKGVRIDSGDITYLSKKVRAVLDKEGFSDCMIMASNSLDEYIIRDTLMQGAKIDSFGVGERLITSKSEPVFGGVYKLVALEKDGKIIPKIKKSENVAKITTPGFKMLYRLFANETGKAIADVVTLHDEVIDDTKEYVIFDPEHTWKKKTVTNFTAQKLLVKVFENGKCIYQPKPLSEVRNYCKDQTDKLWDEVKRFENPHKYYVDLSKPLWEIKNKLLEEN